MTTLDTLSPEQMAELHALGERLFAGNGVVIINAIDRECPHGRERVDVQHEES